MTVFADTYMNQQGPILLTRISINPTRLSNHISSKEWDEITFPNLNGATAEV